jgi:1-aminocyclopropane-1-carboxylate deaminase/D-cysteine desulfhydrase-like pyridoxal-dependent ACC family enzyme
MEKGNDFLTKQWLQKVSLPYLAATEISTYMLRLDLIHPLVSGNKWLKLHDWLKKFESRRFSGILTAGGPWSNHLHACGYACHLHQIPMVALIKGNPTIKNAMLNDLQSWNCTIEFVTRDFFYNKSYATEKAASMDYLYIPMGGEGEEGTAGVQEWFNNLPLPHFDYIFCSVGTGTTLKGIAQSNMSFNNLLAIDPGTGDKNLAIAIENINIALKTQKITTIVAGKKMGKLSAETEQVIRYWYEQTGIALDLVYTAPMCHIFQKMAVLQQLPKGCSVLLIHTGGLQGNRSFGHLPTG